MQQTDETAEQRAEVHARTTAAFYHAVDEAAGGSGWRGEDHANSLLGQNILREEIGYFGDWTGTRYGFDQETRDRLLAHARQDTASAFAMARSAFREAHAARRLASMTGSLLLISVALNLTILASLWWPT